MTKLFQKNSKSIFAWGYVGVRKHSKKHRPLQPRLIKLILIKFS